MATSAKQSKEKTGKVSRYWEGLGRRKTAIARVRLTHGKGEMMINDKAVDNFFTLLRHRKAAFAPLENLNMSKTFDASIKVKGGGVSAQAGAIRHGMARAIALVEPDFKKRLRQEGFLTRDPRMVERKKYGLKKARRAPQWAKR